MLSPNTADAERLTRLVMIITFDQSEVKKR